MKNRVITFFRRGRWLQLAAKYIAQPHKIRELLSHTLLYCSKEGLSKITNQVKLLYHYVCDTTRGEYKHYNRRALLLVIAGLIYLVTPIDLFPDFIAGGLIDDVSLIAYIINSVNTELQRYKLDRNNRLLSM